MYNIVFNSGYPNEKSLLLIDQNAAALAAPSSEVASRR